MTDQPRRVRPFLQLPQTPGTPEGDFAPDPPTRRLRPYILTSGRVAGSSSHIGFETQVTAHHDPPAAPLAPELQAIVEACAEPVSVAEISARLRLHLGVAQILVGDLHTAGHVDVQTTDHAQAHDPDTILRVIRGLRTIS